MTERTILSRTASEDPAPSRPAPAARRVAAQAAYETRTMLRVTVEDAIAADEIMSLLMGEKVEPRREFIEQNSKLVLDLDI